MRSFFKELFDYNYHFNAELCDVFMENSEKTSEKSIKLINHVLNAHQIWNNRIEPKQPAFGVWELHAISELKSINQASYEHTLHILDSFSLNQTVIYSNTSGQAFSNSLQDILFHVINHSTYHRGQIATEFKLNGLTPLITDYIFFKREKAEL